MDVLADLVSRDRRRTEQFLHGRATQPYTHHKFCTDAWKTANRFRYDGVGPGRGVAIADDLAPQPLLAFVGASLLGAPTVFGDPPDRDVRLAVGPATAVSSWSVEPGPGRVAYGAEPDDPEVVHFEGAIWSENPTMPPDSVAPDAVALRWADGPVTHADLLSATERFVERAGLTAEDTVDIRASLAEPGTLVAGLLAPLAVDASVTLPGGERSPSVVVGTADADADRVVDPRSVDL